jgi:hypothetical protein
MCFMLLFYFCQVNLMDIDRDEIFGLCKNHIFKDLFWCGFVPVCSIYLPKEAFLVSTFLI